MANHKGGVAKTTTAASLAAALVAMGRSVLAVDLDPQGCLTFSFGYSPERLPGSIRDVLIAGKDAAEVLLETADGVTLLPATTELAGTDKILLTRAGSEFGLQRALESMHGRYDAIIIDCPPSLGIMTLNGLIASEFLLVPMQCETLAHRGVGQLLSSVREARRLTGRKIQLLGVLPTMYDGRSTHARDVLDDVADRYGMPVLAPPIPRTITFAEASAAGTTVLEPSFAGAQRGNKGAQAYRELAGHLAGYWWEGKDLATFLD